MGGIYTMLLAEITKRLSADRKRRKKEKKENPWFGLGGWGCFQVEGNKKKYQRRLIMSS